MDWRDGRNGGADRTLSTTRYGLVELEPKRDAAQLRRHLAHLRRLIGDSKHGDLRYRTRSAARHFALSSPDASCQSAN